MCWQTTVSGTPSYVDSSSSSANALHIKCPLCVKDFRTRGAGPVRSPSDFWVKKFLFFLSEGKQGGCFANLVGQQVKDGSCREAFMLLHPEEESSLSLHALHVWPAASLVGTGIGCLFWISAVNA